jgi:ferredoxin/flavodoxin
MNGIICYYSGTGNTKLAMEYLNRKIRNMDFELYDITKDDIPDFNKYDTVGFATFADYLKPSQLIYDFFDKVRTQVNIPAFVFNTYGGMTGSTLKDLAILAESKGFNVLSGFSLHMPQNYPPMIKKNMSFANAPNSKELSGLNNFIINLENQIKDVLSGIKAEPLKITDGSMISFPQKFPRRESKKIFGMQDVNENLCAECGLCQEVCPYDAIDMLPKPEFDHDKCFGCWACYNHCPEKAIYTKKFKGEYQYKEPARELLEKLG